MSKKSQNGEVGVICLISRGSFPKSLVFLHLSKLMIIYLQLINYLI